MLEVRPIEEGDVDAVADVHVESWRVAYRGILPDDLLDDPSFRQARLDRWRSRRFDGRPPGTATLVAVTDGVVVGFADTGPEHDADDRPTGAGELFAFYLHPRAWGTGPARPLMAAAVDELRRGAFAEAVLWVFRDNPRARAFYARTGWSPLPVAPSVFEVRPGVGATEVKYGRPLGPDGQGPGGQP